MEEFGSTKYGIWYLNIIKKRLKIAPKGYTEGHHIIPKCLGGSDKADNIVKLTAREHFVVHLLLTKMFPNNLTNTIKMLKACAMMAWRHGDNQQRYKLNSRTFERIRVNVAKVMSLCQTGEMNSQNNTKWVFNDKTLKNKKIHKDTVPEEGWLQGRVLNWEMYFIKKQKNSDFSGIKSCKNCNKEYSTNLPQSKFCSKKCNVNFFNHKKMYPITIKKDNVTKHIKHQNYEAYKRCGWCMM